MMPLQSQRNKGFTFMNSCKVSTEVSILVGIILLKEYLVLVYKKPIKLPFIAKTLFCIIFFLGIHKLKSRIPRQYNVRNTQAYDPIPPLAEAISSETWLLCFDEFQVSIDIWIVIMVMEVCVKLRSIVIVC